MTVGRIILRPRGPIFSSQLLVVAWLGASAVGAVINGRWVAAAALLLVTIVLIVRCLMAGLAVVDQRRELVARTPVRTKRVQVADVDVAFFSPPRTRDGFLSKLVLRTKDGRRVRVPALSLRVGPKRLYKTVPTKFYLSESETAAILHSLAELGIRYVDHEPA